MNEVVIHSPVSVSVFYLIYWDSIYILIQHVVCKLRSCASLTTIHSSVNPRPLICIFFV